MAIDPFVEDIVTLRDAAKLYPRNARGKKPHLSAIYRHTANGLRGVKLESIQCGSTRCTSREAVARFFARLTELTGNEMTSATVGDRRSPIHRSHIPHNEKVVDEELDRILGPTPPSIAQPNGNE